MVIDIVSYTEDELALLSDAQTLEVKKAQVQKNKLYAKYQEKLQKYKAKLLKGGTYNSTAYDAFMAKEKELYESELEVIREKLALNIAESSGGTALTAPYVVDYTLSQEERLTIVKNYYESTYSDPAELLAAFETDTVAPVYLEDLYASLHDYFIAAVG